MVAVNSNVKLGCSEQMKLVPFTPPDGGWSRLRDSETGLEFEFFLRDVKSGFTGFRTYKNGKSICTVEAKNLREVQTALGLRDQYVVSMLELRRSFNGSTSSYSSEVRDEIGDLEQLLPSILQGWKLMCESESKKKRGVFAEIILQHDET